jgi:hypothetical protein
LTLDETRPHFMGMLRHMVSLLLLLALFGAASQRVAYAASPTQAAHMSMSMADCMKMMQQDSSSKAGAAKHKGCTPNDCVNFMMACSGLAAVPAVDATPTLARYTPSSIHDAAIQPLLLGQSLPPVVRPPIA